MKITFYLMLTFLPFLVNGQNVFVGSSVESTVAGARYSVSAGYVSAGNLQVGLFYQQSILPKESFYAAPTTLAGVESVIPMVRSRSIRFCADIRAGLADRRFVVLIPGLKTYVRVCRLVEIGAGMHWRYNKPAHELSIQLKL